MQDLSPCHSTKFRLKSTPGVEMSRHGDIWASGLEDREHLKFELHQFHLPAGPFTSEVRHPARIAGTLAQL